MWQQYYVFRYVWYVNFSGRGKTKIAIDYGYGEKAGQIAINHYFRNERLAVRAAERLYRREFGLFEEIALS
jgi:hypothetical protein